MKDLTWKKVCCILLSALLAAGACGCKSAVDPEKAKAMQEAQEAQKAEEASASQASEAAAEEDPYAQAGLIPLVEEDVLWDDAAFELPAVAQLLAYKATFPDSFDENGPSADDFWTVTAMGITAVPPEGAKDYNEIVHLKQAQALDYAAALLPGYGSGGAAPKLEDVYGISGNPRSDRVDVEALSINADSALQLLGRDAKDGSLVMRVHIEDQAGLITMTDWDVLVEPWEDGAAHALPLKIRQFYCVN